MAALVDRIELSNDQQLELNEDGAKWLVQAAVPGVRAAQSTG